mgnify:CR=1 FL=1
MKSITYITFVFLLFSTNFVYSQDWTASSELPGIEKCKDSHGHRVCYKDGNRKNIYELSESQRLHYINEGAKHVMSYPVEITPMQIPLKSLENFFKNDQGSPLRRLIYRASQDISKFRNIQDIYSKLGLHQYPEFEAQRGPNLIPFMGELEKEAMGVTIFGKGKSRGITFSCAACHSNNLFGKKIIGLTNRFPTANEFFHLGKKIASKVPSPLYRSFFKASDEEMVIFKRVKKALTAHFSEKTEHFEATYRVKNKHNKWIWILDRGKIVERDSSNKPLRMTGTLKDISQIKKTEESLKLFARCIQNISDAVVIYDRQYFAVDVNKAFQRITGKDRMNMLGQPLSFTQYPSSFTDDIKKHLLSQGSWHGEIDSIREDGTEYRIDLNIDIIYDENHNISHFVSVFSDITKRKENEAELRKLASSDVLTGLPNRSFFQANQARLVKSNINHALLVFDLDNFKKINDSMGHQIGDAILCQVTKRMLNLVRKQDTIYRLGGDEFSIIIEGTNDIHTITTLAKEILTTIALPFKIRNQEVVLYSSIGIVLFPEDGLTGHELLKNADTAMYHAKGSGGNRYQFFSDSMNKQAVKRLQIENLIRHGLKEDLFTVYYQPKIEIATGKISGMEALVRFETPSKGIISPYIFIPVSEETGQIIDIGEIVLKKACFAAKKWVEARLFTGRVAVNLSAVQFTQSNLVSQIANILKESKLPPKHLELEITEGTVMNSPQTAIDTMLQIRAMGVHLSLDDFGTGYSSLAYLKQFPLNTLKIDKAFIDDIEDSEQGRNMVATIVTIAHNLGMDVVAEGVETNQQLDYLASLKCEQLQGYLYSKPLAHENFQKYLLSHQITNRSTTFN